MSLLPASLGDGPTAHIPIRHREYKRSDADASSSRRAELFDNSGLTANIDYQSSS